MSISRSAQGFAATALLLAGTSFLALTANAPAALARALNGGSGGSPAPAIASEAAAQAAQQAVAATRQTQESLARAARAMQDIQGVQAAARAAAAAAQMSTTAPVAVPNGLGAGGLLPNAPQNWLNANAPTQSVDGNGQTQVGIRQTGAQAILNWTSFNVGARTTLTFDQQGRADWVALNRVDRTMGPSQILGNITADGHVYVVNQSGIIFGGNSQVNVGSLIASTAGITDSQFVNNGIYGVQTGTSFAPSFLAAGGKVVVEAGASISTNAPASATAGGGYVLMIGSQVENAGAITTPKGQAILAAGDDFVLRRGFGTDFNQSSTTRGSEIAPIIRNATSGGVINTGQIFSPQGDITLAGRALTQDGVLVSTASVNQRGTIHLINSASDAVGSVTLTGRSFSAIMPELDSKDTALNSQRDALIAASGRNPLAVDQFDNLSKLADRRDQSRVEIVTGGIVDFQSGSLTMAQGGQVSVSAGKRVFTESGAVIDVSGVTGARLAMSANQVQVNVQGNELRDSPINRDSGALVNKNVWIDIRDLIYVAAGTGGYAGERYYTQGGLLEVGGYLANTPHKIGEWAAVGGTITLAGPEVVAQQGAKFNISGGAVSYDGGYIYSTKLIGTDGRLYSFDDAPASMKFIGAAGGFVRTHNIQGKVSDQLTEVWSTLFDRSISRRWEDGYTVGRDAGRLNLATPTPLVEADIIAEVIKGERQASARAANVADGYKQVQNATPLQGTLGLGRYDATGTTDIGFYGSDVRFGDFAAITAGMKAGDALPSIRRNTAWFDAGYINSLKLGGLDFGTLETITFERPVALADGGRITLVAPVVDFKANVTARGGALSVDNYIRDNILAGRGIAAVLLKDGKASITVREGVTLDLSGQWVNAANEPADLNGQAYINGGSVTLKSTHDVTLQKGSTIDVSSGSAVLANGKFRGGRGGDVALIADQQVLSTQADGLLTLDGDVRGYGASGSGTLKLESGTSISIGGKILKTDGVLGAGEKAPADLVLLQDYFVKAGEMLPGDYTYQADRFMGGDRLIAVATNRIVPRFRNVVLAADWTVPFGNGNTIYTIETPGRQYTITGKLNAASGGIAPTVIPAGTIVSINEGVVTAIDGYILPGDVFPNGIPAMRYVDGPNDWFPVTFAKTILAGTVAPNDLTLAAGARIVAGAVAERAASVKPILQLQASLFQSGFSNYDINGRHGVVVTENTRLDLAMPVYRLGENALGLATGTAPSRALDVWTPPEWTEDGRNARLTQRGGASISLRSTEVTTGELPSAPVEIRAGATIRVDQGQSITLQGRDMIVDGALTAPSGTISLTQPVDAAHPGRGRQPGVIWIGEKGVLDVAARAITATDARGRTYGVVANGGSILIGGARDWDQTGQGIAPIAFVVVRTGAVLDASGTSAVLDIPAGGQQQTSAPLEVASNGGSIVLKSSHGLYLDGTMRAAAGGAHVAGGTLALALEAPIYAPRTMAGDVLRHREFVIANEQGDSPIAGATSLAAARAGLVTGTARLGVDRIRAGGFDDLSVLVNGVLSFDGSVALSMRQSISLYAGAYAMTDAASADARVALAAPYVRLAASTRIPDMDTYIVPAVRWADGYGVPTTRSSNSMFGVTADLIDIRDRVSFGVRQDIDVDDVKRNYTVDRRGFALVDLTSRGDIRLLAQTPTISTITGLLSPGSIGLTAAQIYPATGAFASIRAGYMTGTDQTLVAGSVLDIRRYDTVPDMPYSVFGSLELAAETVNQGGIVRAPLGTLQFATTNNTARVDMVHLLPGSVASVSGDGLTMPYGGTVDGIAYNYNGAAAKLAGAGNLGILRFFARHLDVQSGAVLDLSGGGELTGAGFLSGRGGSVNVLTTPFVNSNPGYTYSARGNQVYAIVPGKAGAYAPVVQEAGFGLPKVGQQITIPEGVPGLAAGTYTLMPATYALLPGAYRVEIGASMLPNAAGVVATGNGSYIASGYLGTANTDIRASLPNRLIVSPGSVVRSHSFYNETGYNAFVLADAVRIGVPRAAMTVDALKLDIQLGDMRSGDNRSAFVFDGDLRIGAKQGSGGYDGTVQLRGVSEIMAAGTSATPAPRGSSVYADEINKLDAPRLVINATIGVSYGQDGRRAFIESDGIDTVLRSGAHLSAAEVILGSKGYFAETAGRLTIEEGASISTIGRGRGSYDSRDGYVFVGNGVLIVSNGLINLVQAELKPINESDRVVMSIGSCVTMDCARTTTLVSEGTIAAATAGSFSIASNVVYGTRNLVLAMSGINLGDDAALAAAAAAGRLAPGLALNQTVLASLLAGNRAIGAPALETLVLNARNSVNVYGAVDLDASKVGRLVFGTPAIYGYGASGDVATIRAGEFVWTGLADAPAAPIADLLGDSRLNIAANRVVLGYGPNAQPNNQVADNRIALGFTDVNISASEYVTANNKSTLGVYHRRGAYVTGEGYQYTGGNLTVAAPLVTGAAGSVNTITAGGDIRIVGTGAAAAQFDQLGGTLALKGTNVTIDSSVVLPSGRLVVTAIGDIVLGSGSRIDLSGRSVAMFDVTKYSWGGDLVLSSSAGNIRQDAGSVIDLSARNNRGGTATVTAMGSSAGQVALNGAIRGGASGRYDASGTLVPYDAAELTMQAQTIADFAGLNARLNAGEVFGARRFQIKQGNLVVGSEVKARNVEIVVDGGSLTVNGTIDASGTQVGAIRLAAMNDLVINGLLDAHATGMRFDSYGLIIDASNRASVELTARTGTLTLTGNAAVDLRAGTDVATGSGRYQNDGVARGTLALNAPRVGGNDIAINVQGATPISGARTIAVYGYRTYDDALEAAVPDVTGHTPQEITQTYLDSIHGDSTAFINAALGNNALSARLAGLGSYHLRPGVDIVSKVTATNPNGDLTIAGDLDLSGYRYGPNANAPSRGFGEPGAINFRASGNLNIRGSVNDGFAPPPATTGDNGWILDQGVLAYGGDLTLPIAITLEADSKFRAGATLNYDLPVKFLDSFGRAIPFPAGTVLPARATLGAFPGDATGRLQLSAGTVIDANIYNVDGSLAYAAGTVLVANVTLTEGMQLDAGTVLRTAATFAPMLWPKGVPLPVAAVTTSAVSLAAGSLIPSLTDVKLPGGTSIELRASSGGRQGNNWAVAPMLGAGATSWDMQFTAGADLGSADVRARNTLGKGNIVLADTHYASRTSSGGTFINLSDAGAAALWAALGFDYPQLSVNDLVGKSQAEIINLLAPGASWQDFVDAYGLSSNFWDVSTGHIELGLTRRGVDIVVGFNGLPSGISDSSQLLNLTRRQLATLYGDPNFTWADITNDPDFGDPSKLNLGLISMPPTTVHAGPSFSVVRTGTGNLALSAAGDIRMDSLYGIYTAGTATTVDPAYNRPRGTMADGTLLGPSSGDYASATNLYQAWYPEQGGNVLIAAGGNLMGDIYGVSKQDTPSSVLTGNWLWRQGTGSTAVDEAIPTAWWINFGAYVANSHGANPTKLADLVGFTGIGALGGGNVAIRVGGEAGAIALRGSQGVTDAGLHRSQGLLVAVGSTGRVGADGSLTLTGGGDIDMQIAGALNPQLSLMAGYNERHALTGSLIDLRGDLHLSAQAIGGLKLAYGGFVYPYDPRGLDLFIAPSSEARSGITLVPGDATMTVQTRGDLVLGGAGDPGRSVLLNDAPYKAGGGVYNGGGQSWFSLWTEHTAINLISAGGNLTPSTSAAEQIFNQDRNLQTDQSLLDGSYLYPPTLRAAALGGSIYYGQNALPQYLNFNRSENAYPLVTLAPSQHGTLEMMAGTTIFGGQYGFTLSGAGGVAPTPFNPAFMSAQSDNVNGKPVYRFTNGSATGTVDSNGNAVALSYFFFGPNSSAMPVGRAADADPVRFYALTGDVIGLVTGEVITNMGGARTWYSGSGPLMVRAGRDIVGAGLAPGAIEASYYLGSKSRGDLIVHSNPNDVSVISAGRDIIYANFDIAGPGAIEISAGRNLYQGDRGAITSIGSITGDKRPGASVAMLAGVGASGPDYNAFAARYLDPANLAVSGTPLAEQPGKVAMTYEKDLMSWLKERYGFAGTDAEARAYFAALAPEQRNIFLRKVYFTELTEGGREYNNASSPRYGSYLRGRQAIATLFPESGAAGNRIARSGDITMFSGTYTDGEKDPVTNKEIVKTRDGAVRTESGGDIQMMAPGGQIVVGVESLVPTDKAGLVTQGKGDIQIYAQRSLLLGLSRIMTTYGGSILGWSAEGDINAGRGSKTTTVYTPPKRRYDKYGAVELSPDATSSGAGIATLNPLPEVSPGDIDLIAPLGTIDAGEAGIRVSGNVNLAALQILNAANIQVQGTSTGIPTVQAPSISAALSTSNATAASQQAATPNQGAGNAQPSVIIVEVLGYGGGDGSAPSESDENWRSKRSERSYNHNSAFQVVGVGELNETEKQALSASERRALVDR
ncbi:filamentous haemagglutinin family protein [Rhodopseudomonas boonkerdii]|uniref:filamentous haemagglutinin family protein n=1 Tax=Rhodopseudomonas boonkerdii TaxID=475937 RepID=UPI001E576F94|nr:filamentous haemagglutinin family protein [Rhodopseudomonas boonkerdii]